MNVFGPHMLRKFPPQTGFKNNQMQMMMPNQQMQQPNQQQMFYGQGQGQMNQQDMMMQQEMNQSVPQQMPIDLSQFDQNDKKDFLGERLYVKISSNTNFGSISE